MTTTRPTDSSLTPTDQLAALVGHKLRLLERLLELSHRQQSLLGEEDLDGLLSLLSAKQRLIDALQKIERALDPFRQQAPEERQWRSAEERAACRQQAERCQVLTAKLLEDERRTTEEMEQRKKRTEGLLQGFDSAAKAQSAYLSAGSLPAHRLDLTST